MTEKFILRKEHLQSFLRKLNRDHELIAPIQNKYGDTLFQRISSMDNLQIDLKNRTAFSPKEFFLPQIETLFEYSLDSSGYKFADRSENKPRIIFGIRSCDTRAVLFYDLVFQEKVKDKYYLGRRKDTILISLGCNEPQPTCFCKSAKSGPFLSHGYDIQLTDLEDRLFVEIGRPKGWDLIQKWSYFFSPALKSDIDEQYETVLESEGKFRHMVDMDAALTKLVNNEVDPAIWEDLGNRCQNCGGCAYICPTCYCFNIFDRPTSENTGERVRTWDACTFAGFSRLAGGHNPRAEKSRRIRRRFYHKLYYDKQKYNIPSCVGCGRCADICFGRIDMLGFLKMVCETTKYSFLTAGRRLGELLLEAGLVSAQELTSAIKQQALTGKPLGAQLIDMGVVTKEAIARALGEQLGVPYPVGNIKGE